MAELREYVASEIEDYDDARLELSEDGEVSCTKLYIKSEADKVIAELKQKLDEQEAENRRLKRALWLARAYRGRDNSILLPSKFMRNVWDNVERKCLKKAGQYK